MLSVYRQQVGEKAAFATGSPAAKATHRRATGVCPRGERNRSLFPRGGAAETLLLEEKGAAPA